MDYIRQYKSFVNSHYLSEGIRITIGLTLPALLLNYFHQLSAGIILSLGASCVIMVDSAGPIRHRRNAMLICDLVIFFVALATGFAKHSPVLLGLLIFLFCFFFSMIAVYGNRASSLGLAALFIMVLNIERNDYGWNVVINALYVLSGGIWYTILSLLLYSFRPYKLTQQALGDCIQSIAAFLRIKALFYDERVDYATYYQLLLKQQASVHEKQNLVRELLFRSRDMIKESTPTGRTLLMIFLDSVDLFERMLGAGENSGEFQRLFANSSILSQYRQLLFQIAEELNETGIAIKSGRTSEENNSRNEHIKKLKSDFNKFRDENRTAANVESFIGFRHLLEGLEDMDDRLHILHEYSRYERLPGRAAEKIDYAKFVSHQDIDPKLWIDNINLQSNSFRHAVRVAIATLLGYLVSKLFPLGHSYWILLTIIVILKPAYSLTKKRNYDRLLGTIAGAAIGLLVVYLTREKNIVLAFMIIFMIGAYSFMRTRYRIFVLLMTPYILLLFYLLYPHDYKTIVRDRLIDTGIGSIIAFLANLLIAPAWEHEQFTDYLTAMLEKNTNYFMDVAGAFAGNPATVVQYKLSRKRVFVALSNLSEAFNRMLAEPKRKQKNSSNIQQFVVLNYMFVSHTATLAAYLQPLAIRYQSDYFPSIITGVVTRMNNANHILRNQPLAAESTDGKNQLRLLNERTNELLEQRKSELRQGITESETKKQLSELKFITDQFNFITKIAVDIERLSHNLIP